MATCSEAKKKIAVGAGKPPKLNFPEKIQKQGAIQFLFYFLETELLKNNGKSSYYIISS